MHGNSHGLNSEQKVCYLGHGLTFNPIKREFCTYSLIALSISSYHVVCFLFEILKVLQQPSRQPWWLEGRAVV